jgi:trehalose synthase
MLKTVKSKIVPLSSYRGLVADELLAEIEALANKMTHCRVLQINATEVGGGVAEILLSEVPLLKGLGIECQWQVLQAPKQFFDVTKRIHNGLQGNGQVLTDAQWRIYEDYNHQLAKVLQPNDWDVIVVHDPQPAAAVGFVPEANRRKSKWIWRCHIDSHHANPAFRPRFAEYLKAFDGGVYTMDKYALVKGQPKQVAIIPVAIDPLVPKNQPMSKSEAAEIVAKFGIDIDKPLVVQVSRFDPWKDPVGVIAAWELARAEVPGLQLALVGDLAGDDPEGSVVLEQVMKLVGNEPDVFVVHDQADNRQVKAFQTHANAVVQKSLREGFGLTVTESLWAGTPVIGSNVGGIPLQIEDGVSGYLVDSIEECAERMVGLVRNPQLAQRLGANGQKGVKEKFLLPRMLRDDLLFWNKVLG